MIYSVGHCKGDTEAMLSTRGAHPCALLLKWIQPPARRLLLLRGSSGGSTLSEEG